jgi:hypothetical protein
MNNKIDKFNFFNKEKKIKNENLKKTYLQSGESLPSL